MLIKACLQCQFHKIKEGEEGQKSYCKKEQCWAHLTKCIATKAIERFLHEEFVISDNILK